MAPTTRASIQFKNTQIYVWKYENKTKVYWVQTNHLGDLNIIYITEICKN